MNTDDLWNGLAGINEMMADCEDPFIEALLKDTGKCKAKDTKKGKVKDTGKGKAKDTGKGKAKDTGKGKAKNMDFTNLFESDDAGDCEDPDTGKAKAKDMDSTNLFPRNDAGDVFYKLPPEEEPLLRGGSVKIQNCLFRFEDGFTPEVEVDYNDIDTSILKHITGKQSAFYSYGKHLIPCMAKYYHAPNPDEKYSLSIHKMVKMESAYDVSDFKSVEEAREHFQSSLFPDDYPSIEDGEVLFENKIKGGVKYLFGYEVYFLTLLTALTCNSLGDLAIALPRSAEIMQKFQTELQVYGITEIKPNHLKVAKELLRAYYIYDNYKCTIEEILNMPVWATTFDEETHRNKLLAKMYSTYMR